MFNRSPLGIAVIGTIVVLLFGAPKLPELETGPGKAISTFCKSYKESLAINATSTGEGGEKKLAAEMKEG